MTKLLYSSLWSVEVEDCENVLAQEISDAIDEEIIRELLALASKIAIDDIIEDYTRTRVFNVQGQGSRLQSLPTSESDILNTCLS